MARDRAAAHSAVPQSDRREDTLNRDIFVTALGQRDNVGDTVLRRAYLDALRPLGTVHVFVGKREPSFTDNLGLQEADRVYRDSRTWRRSVASHMHRGGLVYAYSAGEIGVDTRFGRNYARTAALLALSRRRGNVSVHLGVGVREDDRARRVVSSVLRRSDYVTWRDAWSAELMRTGGVQPDWAFACGSPTGSGDRVGRRAAAIALRWDRPLPPASVLATWSSALREAGLEPMCVAQTGRDGARAEELASALRGRAVVWEGPDHRPAEELVRRAYRTAAVAVTDRLHGAVMAMTEGAVPLIWQSDGRLGKAARTVSVVDPDVVTISANDTPAAMAAAVERARDRHGANDSAVDAARADLDRVRARLIAVVSRTDRAEQASRR